MKGQEVVLLKIAIAYLSLDPSPLPPPPPPVMSVGALGRGAVKGYL